MDQDYHGPMSIACTYSAQSIGLRPEIISIEVDISNGLNSFNIVGLGDRAVSEARDRISAAIKNAGFVSPKQKNQKVVISLAPAESPKEGARFDVAMTIAYLIAAGHIPKLAHECLFFGETSLAGDIKKISGLLPILCAPEADRFDAIFVPAENSQDAILALEYSQNKKGLTIFKIATLRELIAHLTGTSRISAMKTTSSEDDNESPRDRTQTLDHIDFKDIRGNRSGKRALEIAVSGFHHIVFFGPPGTGKTLLAKSSLSICPDLDRDSAIEVAGIYSSAGIDDRIFSRRPPFRSPHHTASYAAILGGGPSARPGDITLAHRGILFVDELPEFSALILEGLRQPLEEGRVTISRAQQTASYPAQFLLAAAMNPCPCGRGTRGGCVCSNSSLDKYRRRISGPIAERIDLWVGVDEIPVDSLSGGATEMVESSNTVRERVALTRLIQRERFSADGSNKRFNSELSAEDIERLCRLSPGAKATLDARARTGYVSGRSIHRIIKMARTIADMERSTEISKEHVLEAIAYRSRSLI